MGFVKFSRVFRFIGLFVGLVVVAYGALLYFIDVIYPVEKLEELAAGQGYTIEALLAEYKNIAIYTFVGGGALIVFGIICFIVFGVRRSELYSGSSYSSSYSQPSSSSSSSRTASSTTTNSNSLIQYYDKEYRSFFEKVAEEAVENLRKQTSVTYRVKFENSSGKFKYKVWFLFYFKNTDYIIQSVTDRLHDDIVKIIDKRIENNSLFSPAFSIQIGTRDYRDL